MTNSLTIKEFIGLHLIHTIQIIAGWTGKNRYIQKFVTADKLLTKHSQQAVLCREEELSELLFDCQPSAVLVKAQENTKIDAKFLEIADKMAIPLILLNTVVEVVELNETLQFSLKLQVNFKAAEYENINFLLGKFEQWPKQSICDLLSLYFAADVVLLDQQFRQIDACHAQYDVNRKLHAIADSEAWYHQYKTQSGREFIVDDRYVYILPLVCRKILIGYLSVLGVAEPFNVVDRKVIKQMGYFGVQNLILQKEVEEVKQKYKDNFVYDLLYDKFKLGYDLVKVFRRWGIDIAQHHQLFVIQADKMISKEKQEHILAEIELVGTEFFEMKCYQVISIILHEQVILIFNCRNNEYKKQKVKKLAEKLKYFLNENIKLSTISIGIGRFYAGMREIHKSYEEAKQALILAGFSNEKNKVSHFEDLGIMALLAQIDKDKLMYYNQMVIGKLIKYDKANETNYLKLLQVYFENNNNLNTTAERLFMHANTVRNHLRKIEEILDIDLQSFNECLQVYIACKTYCITNLR